MADWQQPRFNLSEQLPALKTLLEDNLPAKLAADSRGLPAINDAGWLIGEPTMIGDDEFPAVCISAQQSTRRAVGGGAQEPQSPISVYAAFPYTGNDDGYVHGLAIAEHALKVIMENEATDHWTQALRSSLTVQPAWELNVWQGGLATVTLAGKVVDWRL
ncbi:MAG: hypothetical protein ACOC7J_07615 [Armatimonadota bacterium]